MAIKQLTVPAYALRVGDVVVTDIGVGPNRVTRRRTITKVDTKRNDDRVGVWYTDYSTSFGITHGILIEREEEEETLTVPNSLSISTTSDGGALLKLDEQTVVLSKDQANALLKGLLSVATIEIKGH